MATPNEKLAAWIKANDLTQQAFADKVGLSQSFVSRLCANDSGVQPSVQIAQMLQRETGGAIEWTEWYPAPRSRGHRARTGT